MRSTYAGILLLLLAAHAAAEAPEPSCDAPLLAVDFEGRVVEGSKSALVEAAASGKSLRVGWAIDFDEDGKGDLTHWSDAVFITVWEGEVFTQVQAIHRQRPRRGHASVELPEQFDLWRGLIGSDGVLKGRLDSSDKVGRRQVKSVWCALRMDG